MHLELQANWHWQELNLEWIQVADGLRFCFFCGPLHWKCSRTTLNRHCVEVKEFDLGSFLLWNCTGKAPVK